MQMRLQTVLHPSQRHGVCKLQSNANGVLNAELDELLSLWHRWQQADRGVRGFNSRALLIGDTRAMRVQYEAQIERQDEELDNLRCRQVNHEVRQMDEPHRTAIYSEAQNLCTGLAVWNSPRLPQNVAERDVIVKFARTLLMKRLVNAGVMEA